MPETAVKVHNARGRHRVVLVCEHASAFIPEQFNNLGLDAEAAVSHIAWDPGAVVTARYLSQELDAVLVEGCVSRLIYDCNRPPESPGAMVEHSEVYPIPGNSGLTAQQKQQRIDSYYLPFTNTLTQVLADHHTDPVLVTMHTFTPTYNGVERNVDIGILHDDDSTLADALLAQSTDFRVKRNQPYGPQDGVTHTLKLHGIRESRLNVMIEIRNTLVTTDNECEAMAAWLAQSISSSLNKINLQNQSALETRS